MPARQWQRMTRTQVETRVTERMNSDGTRTRSVVTVTKVWISFTCLQGGNDVEKSLPGGDCEDAVFPIIDPGKPRSDPVSVVAELGVHPSDLAANSLFPSLPSNFQFDFKAPFLAQISVATGQPSPDRALSFGGVIESPTNGSPNRSAIPTSSNPDALANLPLLVTERILLLLRPHEICGGDLLAFAMMMPANFRYWLSLDSHFARQQVARTKTSSLQKLQLTLEYTIGPDTLHSISAWAKLPSGFKRAIFRKLSDDASAANLNKLSSNIKSELDNYRGEEKAVFRAFSFACLFGRDYMVKEFLQDGYVPAPFPFEGLKQAADGGFSRTVELLMLHLMAQDVQKVSVAETVFEIAFAKRYVNIAKTALILVPDLKDSISFHDKYVVACRENMKSMVSLFLSVSDPLLDGFLAAAEHGHESIISLFLEAGQDPGSQDNAAFRLSARHHHVRAMEVLFADPHTKPGPQALGEALLEACGTRPGSSTTRQGQLLNHERAVEPSGRAAADTLRNGHPGVVAILLQQRELDPNYKSNEALRDAAKNGYPAIVNLMIQDERVHARPKKAAALYFVLKHSNLLTVPDRDDRQAVEAILDVVKALSAEEIKELLPLALKETKLALSSFTAAVKLDNKDIFDALLAHPELNPGSLNNAALIMAIRLNKRDMLKCLLAHPKVDATLNESYLLRLACENGSLEIVSELLEHGKVDICASDNACVRAACRMGNLTLLSLLLSSMKLTSESNTIFLSDCLMEAARNGHAPVAELLLVLPFIEVTSEALREACTVGCSEIVTCLLKDGRATPDEDMLCISVQRGESDMCKMLLNYVTPRSAALRQACIRGNVDILAAILKHTAFDMNLVNGNDAWAITLADSLRHQDVVKLLQDHGAVLPPPIDVPNDVAEKMTEASKDAEESTAASSIFDNLPPLEPVDSPFGVGVFNLGASVLEVKSGHRSSRRETEKRGARSRRR
ncbi:hypothetical protein BC830DRAFT_1172381 [Chytriomyces sp. MP71]|nr:hypothetical protein BC830DRAFT_1172381 [Chytriomyces sp. MP71]